MTAEIKWNKAALDALDKLLTQDLSVKVGVLDDGALHPGDKIGAAALAAVHEFGSASQHIPERSFLRKTEFMKKDQYLGWIDKNRDELFKAVMEGKLYFQVLPKVGALWVSYIIECFKSGGFGSWKPLKVRVGGKPLIDTGALLRSISFEVTDE